MNKATATLQDGGIVALRMRSPMVSEDADHVWIDVAFEGTWDGHRAGSFTFDRDVFEQIIANFEANPNPIPLDYEHASEWATEAPAAGWVQKLECRNDDDGVCHLWAFCELGEKAASQIRKGEYRFSSGVFDFEATSLKTGEAIGVAMYSLALTNTPFIRGQEPISLSFRASKVALGGPTVTKISIDAIKDALDALDSPEVSPDQVMSALDFAVAKEGAAEEPEAPEAPLEEEPEAEMPLEDGPEEEPEEELPLAEEPEGEMPLAEEPEAEMPMAEEPEAELPLADDAEQTVLAPLMEATGMDMADLAAALVDNQDAVVSALQGSAGASFSDEGSEHALSASRVTLAKLQKEVKALSAELAERRGKEADEAIELLVCSGRLLDTGRKFARKLFLSDRSGFDDFTASLPQVVPVDTHVVDVTEERDATAGEPADIVALRRSLRHGARLSGTRLTQEAEDAAVARHLERSAS